MCDGDSPTNQHRLLIEPDDNDEGCHQTSGQRLTTVVVRRGEGHNKTLVSDELERSCAGEVEDEVDVERIQQNQCGHRMIPAHTVHRCPYPEDR